MRTEHRNQAYGNGVWREESVNSARGQRLGWVIVRVARDSFVTRSEQHFDGLATTRSCDLPIREYWTLMVRSG